MVFSLFPKAGFTWFAFVFHTSRNRTLFEEIVARGDDVLGKNIAHLPTALGRVAIRLTIFFRDVKVSRSHHVMLRLPRLPNLFHRRPT